MNENMMNEKHHSHSDEVLVRVEGVSKKFCRSLKRSLWYGVCDIAGELAPFGRRPRIAEVTSPSGSASGGNISLVTRHQPLATASPCGDAQPATSNSPLVTPAVAARDEDLREGEFYAVRDVSFELRRGECLGLIGHNGAGKTTLLKMLNGLIKPDTGRIEMNGRVGALIALGAGFNPILTGRENIYINGSVLGLSKKEIDEKIEEIIDFAEIGEFIDAPVQNYSSGMQVRLGFSVASSLSPDILILDEVLAVGDIGFVIKCLNRVRNMTAKAAVVLVSHNMQFISSFCSRVIFMERGKTRLDTEQPAEAIGRYYEMISPTANETGTREARILHLALRQGKVVYQGCNAELELAFEIDPSCPQASIQIYIMDETMAPVVCFPINGKHGQAMNFGPGRHDVVLVLGPLDLVSGKYSFTVAIADMNSKCALIRSQGLHEFRIFADQVHWGRVVRPIVVN
jgi:lipopolysaccharide transport system ATP-binding protein